MANENEELQKPNADQQSNEGGEGHPHHTSFLGSIIEKIEEELKDMDVDFPLAGGNDHPVHHHRKEEEHAEGQEEGTEHKEEHKSWFSNIIDKIQDLDTDFPLSGGEEDPRPPHHK